MIIPKPMTKDELATSEEITRNHVEAIEKAIGEFVLDEPEDKVWPDYFRGNIFEVLSNVILDPDEKVKDSEYETECVWFQAGWMALVNKGK